MYVRKAISDTLDYLVIGKRASPLMVAEAEAIGIPVITEDEFFELED
jgi:BRCT domain type II-containing protein